MLLLRYKKQSIQAPIENAVLCSVETKDIVGLDVTNEGLLLLYILTLHG